MGTPQWVRDQVRARELDGVLNAPQQFAGGTVVAAIRLMDVSGLVPGRHVVMCRRETAGRRAGYSTHEIAPRDGRWLSEGQGHYDLAYSQAVADMAARAGAAL